jgi:uncharacterized protein (DUF433 family)
VLKSVVRPPRSSEAARPPSAMSRRHEPNAKAHGGRGGRVVPRHPFERRGIGWTRAHSGLRALAGEPILACVLDWSQCSAVERLPDRLSGAWVFKGTRVPVVALFENLEDGARIDDFLDWFPGVKREQVEAVLQHAEQSLKVA